MSDLLVKRQLFYNKFTSDSCLRACIRCQSKLDHICAMCFLPVALQLTLVKPLCHCRLTAQFHHHSPADVRRHVNASLNTQSPFRQNSKLVIKTTDNTIDITLVYFLKAYNCSHLHLKTTGVMFQEFLGFNQKYS